MEFRKPVQRRDFVLIFFSQNVGLYDNHAHQLSSSHLKKAAVYKH